jgi:hypothetical protein
MRARLQWDRRTFLAWGIATFLTLAASGPVAAETALAVLHIDGMT